MAITKPADGTFCRHFLFGVESCLKSRAEAERLLKNITNIKALILTLCFCLFGPNADYIKEALKILVTQQEHINMSTYVYNIEHISCFVLILPLVHFL